MLLTCFRTVGRTYYQALRSAVSVSSGKKTTKEIKLESKKRATKSRGTPKVLPLDDQIADMQDNLKKAFLAHATAATPRQKEESLDTINMTVSAVNKLLDLKKAKGCSLLNLIE
jgi:hypothetical protein